jgi:hypothetical protein
LLYQTFALYKAVVAILIVSFVLSAVMHICSRSAQHARAQRLRES